MTEDKTNYGESWDKYYSEQIELSKSIPWDVEAEIAVEKDHKIFEHYFDKALVLIDLGCGTGRQSIWLHQYYPDVLGLDISESVIQLAKTEFHEKGLDFICADILNKHAIDRLKKQYGDVNIYMRGVLQQIKVEDRIPFSNGLKTLLGKSGRIYLNELQPSARKFFMPYLRKSYVKGEALKKVLKSGVTSLEGVAPDWMNHFFSMQGFNILQTGENYTVVRIDEEVTLEVPSCFAVMEVK